MKTLWKKDSKDKIRIWTIYTSGYELIQESGLENGRQVVHRKSCIGKNIGKSNATSPAQQAIAEMRSLITDKLSEGYFLTKDEAENEIVILPMLASDYNKHSKKIDWSNCYIQPKLDGMRCLAIIKDGVITLKSRDGKVIENMNHITIDLSDLDDCILDGELYCHGRSFQENMKLIKKYRKDETENIKYHVYDIISDNQFSKRKVRKYIENKLHCKEVSTYQIVDERQLKINHAVFIQDGYEGSIIRHGVKPYEMDKRSDSLLKYKDFSDIAIKIHDVVPSEAVPENGQFIFYWKGAKGHSYGDNYIGCGMKFSHEERREILLNKTNYIGMTAEVRYFEFSDEGVPRFPVCVGIRLDK